MGQAHDTVDRKRGFSRIVFFELHQRAKEKRPDPPPVQRTVLDDLRAEEIFEVRVPSEVDRLP